MQTPPQALFGECLKAIKIILFSRAKIVEQQLALCSFVGIHCMSRMQEIPERCYVEMEWRSIFLMIINQKMKLSERELNEPVAK